MSSIFFAGGGSGGHVFPGVAVAEELAGWDPDLKIHFIGTNRSLETHILSQRCLTHIPLSVSPSTQFLRSPISSTVRNWRAYQSASRLLSLYRPQVVVGLGGFASVPVVLAARRHQIPVVLLEQNAILGRANRFLLPFVQHVCLSFDNIPFPARYQAKICSTGNPIRACVSGSSPANSPPHGESGTLVVLGGSQGATAVNNAVIRALPGLSEHLSHWRIIHQTGSTELKNLQSEYAQLAIASQVVPFIDDMGTVYSQADIVISRAGGTTLAELAHHGIPSILIPYPGSIRDHQLRNVERFVQVGGAVLVEQSSHPEQTAVHLQESLLPLLTQVEHRERMREAMFSLARPEACQSVASLIAQYLQSQPNALAS